MEEIFKPAVNIKLDANVGRSSNKETVWISENTSLDWLNKMDQQDIDCKTINGFKKKLEKIRNKWTGQANNRLSERSCH